MHLATIAHENSYVITRRGSRPSRVFFCSLIFEDIRNPLKRISDTRLLIRICPDRIYGSCADTVLVLPKAHRDSLKRVSPRSFDAKARRNCFSQKHQSLEYII